MYLDLVHALDTLPSPVCLTVSLSLFLNLSYLCFSLSPSLSFSSQCFSLFLNSEKKWTIKDTPKGSIVSLSLFSNGGVVCASAPHTRNGQATAL